MSRSYRHGGCWLKWMIERQDARLVVAVLFPFRLFEKKVYLVMKTKCYGAVLTHQQVEKVNEYSQRGFENTSIALENVRRLHCKVRM